MRRIRIVLAALALGLPAAALTAQQIAVHRDPGCGCCEKWTQQVRAQFGRQVRMIDDAQRKALHKRFGMPADLASCHTAIIDGMAFEGHVPIADMKRALAQRPKGVTGLAVAGMPLGSPGMEVPGQRAQPFIVFAFGPGGKKVFARHGG
ncbi:DUF411 domain-containing protein [Sphingomonas sp. BT-65]|uniref:DUF411 domain-containing protein n=1 Tax=Sphingomonas sp. BT-65 TaxID=2989821 RepID=UPI0022356F4A|nr:DUF411 domain-containing protein [Sphingomonas sp. BT-65]MCW4463551.1 DUF411 domain-containing protein [Sphingomonas sp. BT-65]